MSDGPHEEIIVNVPQDSPTAVRLLLKWSERARANQSQHWEAARYYEQPPTRR
jgi:hypothetical protein